MKRTKELEEYRGLSEADLASRLHSLQEELMNLRFRHRSGQLDQTSQLQTLRKRIARAKTLLRARVNEQQPGVR